MKWLLTLLGRSKWDVLDPTQAAANLEALAPPAPIVPVVEITAQPLVIGDGQDPVKYARYRLDAIARHIEHNATLKPTFMAEARQETFDLLGALHKAGVATAEEEAAALKRVGIGG